MCGDYTYPAMSYFWKRKEDVADRDNPHIVKLLEAMEARKPEGVNILYSRGCDWTEEIETKYGELGDERAWEYDLLHRKVDSGEKADKAEALRMAQQADVIVAAVGENVMLCGENRDRQSLRLPGKQEQFVEELINTGKPVVLVVFGGRAQVISEIAERCAAVIQAWYPGEEGGNAVADILYGKVSPSAKLAISYPNQEIYEPICYNDPSEIENRKSLNSKLQWPFGYGLSYTTFDYSNLQMPEEVKTDEQSLTLTFDVKNTGKMAADEIVQIYLSPTTEDQQLRPIQLQGFARVSLQPGETKKVSVKLYTEQFGYFNKKDGQRSWTVDPGTYAVKVGASSVDFRLQQQVTLTGQPVSKPIRDYYFSEVALH
jgi:beta-glucosidase